MTQDRFPPAAAVLFLAFAAVLAAGTPVDPPRPWDVKILAPDRVELFATVYPAGAGETGKPSPAPAILFVHGLGRSRADWKLHGKALQKLGIFSMAVDLRGHGESVQRTVAGRVEEVTLEPVSSVQDEGMAADLAAAAAFLLRRKEVDPSRLILVGADLGANLAAGYAADHPKRVAALALLSPRWEIRSVSIRESLKHLGAMPVLVAGSDAEIWSAEFRAIGQEMAAAGNEPASVFAGKEADSAGGCRLLDADEKHREVSGKIIAWILGRAGLTDR